MKDSFQDTCHDKNDLHIACQTHFLQKNCSIYFRQMYFLCDFFFCVYLNVIQGNVIVSSLTINIQSMKLVQSCYKKVSIQEKDI